jgi:predicted flap endonuclease-1-like 5' DNA nuclease
MEGELQVLRDSQARLAAELDRTRSSSISKEDAEELRLKLRTMESSEAQLTKEKEALAKKAETYGAEILHLRNDSVPRGEYERARIEVDKARNDLSRALETIGLLKKRLEGVVNAASIEKMKANLLQEEKAHGVMRIQYRNLETKLYEVTAARKSAEADLKTVAKERDQLQSQLKSYQKGSVVKVVPGTVEDAEMEKPKRTRKKDAGPELTLDEAIPEETTPAIPPLEDLLADQVALATELTDLLGDRGAAHVKKFLDQASTADGEPADASKVHETVQNLRRQVEVLRKSRDAAAAFAETPDDLTEIKGIAKVINQQLKEAGIHTFRQIADWTEDEVAAFNDILAFKGRIQREKWQAQAHSFLEAPLVSEPSGEK